jgi:hypothetical protein
MIGRYQVLLCANLKYEDSNWLRCYKLERYFEFSIMHLNNANA